MVCVILQEYINNYSCIVSDDSESFDITNDDCLSIIPKLDKFDVQLSHNGTNIYFTIGYNGESFGAFYIDDTGDSCTKYEVTVMAESMAKDLEDICKIISKKELVFYDLKLRLINVYGKYSKQLARMDFNL